VNPITRARKKLNLYGIGDLAKGHIIVNKFLHLILWRIYNIYSMSDASKGVYCFNKSTVKVPIKAPAITSLT
jgi:hypothetical protein